ncbi:MAG: hypothetical protein J0M10_12125 [Chitinophagales bacterium]|nr:hypothetical protein [Chitinophagales bacterium]
MKKFFAIAFIAATVVACNNSSESKEGADSTAIKDSIAKAAATADSLAKAAAADTTKAADTTAVADTTKK